MTRFIIRNVFQSSDEKERMNKVKEIIIKQISEGTKYNCCIQNSEV